jgi:hypothetical protein
METDYSLPYLQQPAVGSCSEQNISSPDSQTISLRLSFSVLSFLVERKQAYEIMTLSMCVCASQSTF